MHAPIFEVIEPAATAEARRLTTVETVSAAMSDDAVVPDTVLAPIIDQVTATMARFANLAVDVRGTPPTFAAEGLRATWPASRRQRSPRLLLPWRVPITEIASVVVQAMRETSWRNSIEVVSGMPHWMTLRVSCGLLTADRLVRFMTEYRSDVPEEERDLLMTAFREMLMNAMEHGAGFDPEKVIEVSAARTGRAIVYHFRDPVLILPPLLRRVRVVEIERRGKRDENEHDDRVFSGFQMSVLLFPRGEMIFSPSSPTVSLRAK